MPINPNNIHSSYVLKQKEGIFFIRFSEGAVLFHQKTRQLWPLNHSAAATWCFLEGADDFSDLVNLMSTHFNVEPEIVRPDVENLLEKFTALGLIGSKPLQTQAKTFNAVNSIKLSGKKFPSPAQWDTNDYFKTPDHLIALHTIDCPAIKSYTSAMQHLKVSGQQTGQPGTQIWIIPTISEKNKWDIFIDQQLYCQGIPPEKIPPTLIFLTFNKSVEALKSKLLFHAGVLEKNGNAYIFPANAGCGKSTLCTTLIKNGFNFLSDELALIDPETLRTQPMPLPICIKSGSMAALKPFYSELEKMPSFIRGDGKEVRYLRPDSESIVDLKRELPVAALIFPRFNKSAKLLLKELSKSEAMKHLVKTGSSDRPLTNKDIEALIGLVDSKPCYIMEYANIMDTLDLLKKI